MNDFFNPEINMLLRVFFFLLTLYEISYALETFESLVQKSAAFNQTIPFPVYINRIKAIAGGDINKKTLIEKQANSVRPILHHRVVSLINKFLDHKKTYGTSIEKNIYQEMTALQFIDRLLQKRPIMFMNPDDFYLLRNGAAGYGNFEKIGTNDEKAPLLLKDYLSYDEMQISALLGVSTPTSFINNGNRYNHAIPTNLNDHEEEGIYIGLVGARFEKPGLMEWQHIIITTKQNTRSNGYGKSPLLKTSHAKLVQLWSDFYEETFAMFEEAQRDMSGRFIKLNEHTYFDSVIYRKRISISAETFLIEANERGKAYNKKVYCHIVGLGLHAWKIHPLQTKFTLQAYGDVLSRREFPFISNINFSYFDNKYKSDLDINHVDKKTKLHFSQRNPADKLIGDDADKLLVAMYAWDGNAFPGNEYWKGSLSASGDPAAACCSTIAELQNPLINSNVSSQKLFISK